MIDIVRIFQDYAEGKGQVYLYGRKNVLNLIDQANDLQPDKVYFLHEFREGTSVKGDKIGTKGMKYNGKFFLVKQSDLDQEFFNSDETEDTKYKVNIEPLLEAFDSLSNFYSCSLLDVELLKFIDVTDVLDANMDGLLITYTVTVPKNYGV